MQTQDMKLYQNRLKNFWNLNSLADIALAMCFQLKCIRPLCERNTAHSKAFFCCELSVTAEPQRQEVREVYPKDLKYLK